MTDLDLDLLRCFVAVVETSSFTLAAKRMHLTQPAVTMKIKRLEEILGQELISRKGGEIALTLGGELALGYSHRLLDLGEQLIERLAKSSHSIRIGLLYHLGFQDFPFAMCDFKRQWPSLNLSLEMGVAGELLDGLQSNRLDIVIASAGYTSMDEHKMSASVSECHLRTETLTWVESETSQLHPQADPLPLVTFGPLCRFRPIAFDVLQKANRTWEVVYTGTTLAAVQSAVQADLGYSFLPAYSIGPGISVVSKQAGLPSLPQVNLSLYSRKSPMETLQKRVCAFIAESAARWRPKPVTMTELELPALEPVDALRILKSG
jgi:DNA-binding transcriptional LysR family regulator